MQFVKDCTAWGESSGDSFYFLERYVEPGLWPLLVSLYNSYEIIANPHSPRAIFEIRERDTHRFLRWMISLVLRKRKQLKRSTSKYTKANAEETKPPAGSVITCMKVSSNISTTLTLRRRARWLSPIKEKPT